MTKKKATRARTRRASQKLSTPANVARLIALLSDTTQPDARARLEEWADEVTNEFGQGVWMGKGAAEVKSYRPRLSRALRLLEAKPRRSRSAGLRLTWRAYDWLAEAVARTSEGETLAAYVAEWEARKAESETDKRTLAQIKKRAREIVRDVRAADADTRFRIDLALISLEQSESGVLGEYADNEGYERTLRSQVAAAERGESLSDFSGVRPEAAEAARAFLALQSMDGLPEYVFEATQEVLRELGRASGAGLWREPEHDDEAKRFEMGDWSAEILARIFNKPPDKMPSLTPALDLAGMIAAVLNHPDLPSELREGMNEGLDNLLSHNTGAVTTSADYVAALLKHSGGKGGDE